MIISQVVQCDWPGCQNEAKIKGDEPLNDWITEWATEGAGKGFPVMGWEFRCGDLVVCSKHKFKSSEELERELELSWSDE